MRPAWIEVDLDAIGHNTRVLARQASPAKFCAVVKADGYGHGAVPVARAALGAGAHQLAVATVAEGVALREADIDAPILLLSEAPPEEMPTVVAHRLTPTVYRDRSIEAARAAAARAGTTLGVHVKIDTGMHRVGAPPEQATDLVAAVVAADHLRMDGLFTHLAVADEPGDPFTQTQLARLDTVVAALAGAGLPTGTVHAANSAATLRALGRHDLVRCGISLYGFAPSPQVADTVGLRPALSVHAKVSYTKRVAAGEGLSYGLRYRPAEDTQIVTLPLGYADGVRRILSRLGAGVLIGGRRYPIVGTITMDQLLVDTGPDGRVRVGEEAVLIGHQGDRRIGAEDWAARLDTITYEIVCAFGLRLPRIFTGAVASG